MAKKKAKKGSRAAARVPAKRGRPPSKEKKPAVPLAKRIEFMSPKDLKGYAQNAKAHSLEQIELLANSIMKFGFNAPILIDGSHTVVAGHGRLAAALKLNLEHVPVVILDHMSDDERRAYIIADNKLGEVGTAWSDEFLSRELQDLDLHDFDLSVLGFDESELGELLPDLEGEADEILARDEQERGEQDANQTSEAGGDAQTEVEHGDRETDEERETRGEGETEEIDVERPPDMIVRKPAPAAIAEVLKTINLPSLEREIDEKLKAAEDETEVGFWTRMKNAISFARTHFDVVESKDETENL